MNLESALQRLFSLHTFGIKLGLDNIKAFLDHIGNPQNYLKSFHIAGSNGKGSTASFIASILQECNYKVGLYTSPHFVKFNERIMINDTQINDEAIAEFISKHEKYIFEHGLTFFEVTTALAFNYFYENKVDYAVIETGLGGRLDATNVFNALGVIITSISLEHTNILGGTIKEIAGEKAAIIKNHNKVFTGNLPDEAQIVVEEKCKETKSELYKILDYVNEKPGLLELYTEEIELDEWTMPLRGSYQKYNAALAALAVSKILDLEDTRKIEAGIKNVIVNTGFQGRYEFYNKKPDIIFDSAHNPEGISNFISEFSKDYNSYSERVLIFGAMKDKDALEILKKLKKIFNKIFITQINSERSFKIEELIRVANEAGTEVEPLTSPASYIENFRLSAGENGCLVVLGSMYLLGEVKSLLHNKFT
jgi:dihydrofolate synthase / folylpolyglutamate synthase